jgi:hypothetical protein
MGISREVDPDSYVTGQVLGRLLCEVLGLDPEKVSKLVVVADPREVATVYVTRIVTAGEMTSFAPRVRGAKVEEVASVDYDADRFEVVTTQAE